MWKNYLTVGIRALAKNKTYTIINVVGLALGLASCLMLLLYVRYESRYDAWLPDAERVFQLQDWVRGEGSEPPGGSQQTSFVSGAMLRKDFPQFEHVVYALNGFPVILQNGEATSSEHFLYVDGPLFEVLQLPFLRGDRRTALASPGSIVLTASEAAKRFGTADPLGKTLTTIVAGKATDYRITGVVEDPRHSHLALSMVARFDPPTFFAGQEDFLTEWMPKNGWVYAKLKPGVDVADITRQMPAWEKRNIPDQMVGGERFNSGDNHDWRLINIRDVHMGVAQRGGMRPGNDRRTIVTFSVVAALILFMAWVNYTNLATARASRRAREVALRKVLGASRRQLITQFLGESLLVAATAMIVALALVELSLPLLNRFLGVEMTIAYWGGGGLIGPVLGLVLLIGVAGGLYPAFFLSRFQPSKTLKANMASADAPGTGRLRGLLVVAQFAVSIGLISCTAIIYAQTVYGRTADPGYERDGLIQIENIGRIAIRPMLPTLLNEIGKVEGVESVGRSTIGVATFAMENLTVTPPAGGDAVEFNLYRVDPAFFRTMGIETLAGRTFVEGRAMDDSTIEGFPPKPTDQAALARRGYNIVLNAYAASLIGYKRPQEAIGKILKADDGDVEANGRTPVTIVGIVEDSRFRSIRDDREPMMFVYDRLQPSFLLVRYSGSPGAVRDRIEQVWKRIAPEVPFDARFSEDIVRELYDAEEARAAVFAAFAALAVVIACLGLFGLAAFTAERRTKEIGIRKVFGARVRDIVRLLVWQFSKPVVVANLAAWPAAWWAMRDWLNTFDARIALTPGPFVMAGLLALAIAVATVAGHAVRVARLNPIHALRYE